MDLIEISSMKPLKFKICYSVESYDKNIAQNLRNFKCRKVHTFQTVKDIDSKFI